MAAEKKKITRKVIPEGKNLLKEPAEEKIEEEPSKVWRKGCSFCKSNSNPTYTDLVALRRFLTDRAKILPRARSGACSKHQRAVAKNIKYARHLALLPFVPKV